MANGNNTTVVGNVTRDPELRFTPSGLAVSSFGLAYNDRKFNKETQEYDEKVSFFDVTCWQDLAENVGESVQKGDRVIVTGRLEQRSWETQDGDKRSKVEIVADEVGPSLRWASTVITKNERKGSAPAPRQQAPVASAPDSYNGGEDEPF